MFKITRTAALLAGLLLTSATFAQPAPDNDNGPDYGPAASNADAADPPSRVARLALIDGAVSFVPAGEDDWVEAQLNRPLISGDKLWTDRGARAELQIGESVIRVDQQSSFNLLNLDDQTAQVELTQGTLNLRVRRLDDDQTYEIDTPTLAFVDQSRGRIPHRCRARRQWHHRHRVPRQRRRLWRRRVRVSASRRASRSASTTRNCATTRATACPRRTISTASASIATRAGTIRRRASTFPRT